MNYIFVDTSFYIALIHETDKWHNEAQELESYISRNKSELLVTTYEVLSEVLAYFSRKTAFREAASNGIAALLCENRLSVYDMNKEAFGRALALYAEREDKTYSLVDCLSMNIMREHDIRFVISYDGDFEQEGFTQVRRVSEIPL